MSLWLLKIQFLQPVCAVIQVSPVCLSASLWFCFPVSLWCSKSNVCFDRCQFSVDADAADWRGRGDASWRHGEEPSLSQPRRRERWENRGRPEERDKSREMTAPERTLNSSLNMIRRSVCSLHTSNAWRASRIKVICPCANFFASHKEQTSAGVDCIIFTLFIWISAPRVQVRLSKHY